LIDTITYLLDLLGVAAAFVLRGLALVKGWSLPVYRPRPARRPENVGL
jgi:hypothetical protein